MTLQLHQVTKNFGEHTAVNNLTLSIPEGEMFGMLGANGAGKTTTFRMIIGLLDPTNGTIRWRNAPLSYKNSTSLGYLPEERGLYPKLRVVEQLLYLGRLRGLKKQEIIAEMRVWLERFDIRSYENVKVEELSKGNQQKIQFIAAVLHKPELLILDEPFSGLDPVNVEMLKKAVHDLKQSGTTIIFSSHRMEHVEELCEHLAILHSGKPVVHGNINDIKSSFGKQNIRLKTDFDCRFLENIDGVMKYEEKAGDVWLQVTKDYVAKEVFAALQGKGFVRHFALEEPTLEEIFIEKVGMAYA
ncbi:ABC transporter ATP-binding protein [Salsuginibacillus kocurii]|uniref:ABC transporter ATP-binding protein n=1 Tax=Salsuginibacillus kocurii TaxID=427078 RepID=UPI0003673B78|nr:ABC transporter ATP-binding protein [Salsuginibacillus kocurii]